MKNIFVLILFLVVLSFSFLSCRNKRPCPTFTVYEQKDEEANVSKSDS